jgi:hypothetical protein
LLWGERWAVFLHSIAAAAAASALRFAVAESVPLTATNRCRCSYFPFLLFFDFGVSRAGCCYYSPLEKLLFLTDPAHGWRRIKKDNFSSRL